MSGAQQAAPMATPYTPWPSSDLPRMVVAQQPPPPRQQQPAPPLGGGAPIADPGLEYEQTVPYAIQLEVPSIGRVAQSVESDAQLKERVRQENRERKTPERITFPDDPIISTDTYQGRKWNPMKMEVAPYYVCHGRLYFEQTNFERYGWGLGVFTPLINASAFLYDFVTWPYHLAVEPWRRIEYNTGYCLPGDPVPLLLFPLHPSATGFVAEVSTILTLVAVFP